MLEKISARQRTEKKSCNGSTFFPCPSPVFDFKTRSYTSYCPTQKSVLRSLMVRKKNHAHKINDQSSKIDYGSSLSSHR